MLERTNEIDTMTTVLAMVISDINIDIRLEDRVN